MSPRPPEQNRAIACTLLAVDRQRSPLHALTAAQQQALAFTAYGTRNPQDTPVTALGFTGERRITSTGHYLLGNGYRAFNPVLMRFNSPDALSPFGRGGLNSYAYCAGDPVNRVDPAGKTWSWLKTIMRRLGVMRPSAERVPAPGASLYIGSNALTSGASVSSRSGSQRSLNSDAGHGLSRSLRSNSSGSSDAGSRWSVTSSFRAAYAAEYGDPNDNIRAMLREVWGTPSSGRSRSSSVSSQGSVSYDQANASPSSTRSGYIDQHLDAMSRNRPFLGETPQNAFDPPPSYSPPPSYRSLRPPQPGPPPYEEVNRIRKP
jgi:RHS repeat-associated protein